MKLLADREPLSAKRVVEVAQELATLSVQPQLLKQVSCHPPVTGADGRIDGYLAPGSRMERRADSSILGAAAAPLAQLSPPYDRLHASPGPPSTVRPGSAVAVPPAVKEHADAAAAVETSALLPQLQLQNPSNYCYSHACLLAYLWLIVHSPFLLSGPGLEPLKSFLTQARCSKSILLWSLLPWRQAMRRWRQPSRQHDAADFLLHLQGLWQIL